MAIGALLILALALISLGVYFIPSIIAIVRRHKHALAIFLINLFTGWTFFGWVAALVWSVV